MKKIALAVIGAIAISIGAVDWLGNAFVSHSWFFLITGFVALAVAGFIHGWQRQLRREPKLPLLMTLVVAIFSSVNTSAAGIHDVLIPPATTPIQQWNPNVVSGSEAWVWVLVIALALVLIYVLLSRFLHGCSSQP